MKPPSTGASWALKGQPDDDNRDALALLLLELGYSVSTASSLDQGVEMSATIEPDVVLVAAVRDLKDMREVVRRFREASSAKIIVLSGIMLDGGKVVDLDLVSEAMRFG